MFTTFSFLRHASLLVSEQRFTTEHIFNGSDVFVWLPTGFGKSICYQVLPYLFDAKFGTTKQTVSAVVVVSPLLSLMVDQVRSLRNQGARAAILTSESSVPDAGLIATSADLSLYYCDPDSNIYNCSRCM